MRGQDRELGMHRAIHRRDFVNGAAVALGASLLPKWSWALALDAAGGGAGRRRRRVSAAAHRHARQPRRVVRAVAPDARSAVRSTCGRADHTGETYDLVVVGGGLSGLAAAYYFVQNVGRSARVLVLDNHDDFGGHAKRNEFVVDGKLLALNGGTLNIESPLRYNQPSRQLLAGIGVDLDRFVKNNDRQPQPLLRARPAQRPLLRQGDVGRAITWRCGRRRGGRGRGGFPPEYLDALPISDQAKADMRRLHDPNQPDYMPGLTSTEKKDRLARMSLEHYLLEVAKVDKQCLWFFMATGRGVFCVGADAIPALFGWEMGVPGLRRAEARADARRRARRSAGRASRPPEGRGRRRQHPLPRRQRHGGPPAGALADSRRGAWIARRRTSAPRMWTTRGSIAPGRPRAFA